ncbi:MAG: lytic transglycosylase domain-containing protein [Bacteroidales bacterium]|nr:lytic transglycosylase domain-containing protein [Bacteroidales bacterium]
MNKPLAFFLMACCLAAPVSACAQGADVPQEYEPEPLHFRAPRVPEFIEFAGQTYRFDRPDLYERMDRELINFTYGHTNSTLMLKRADRIFRQIVPILEKNGIPEDLKYLMAIESNLDPKAYSSAGAAGLWQFMKATGRGYGLEVGDEVDERYHIAKSTEAACKYLKEAYAKYKDWMTVAASYNAGQGGISKRLTDQKQKKAMDLFLPTETSRYMFRILTAKYFFENPEAFGFQVDDSYPYLEPKETVSVSEPIPSLTDFAIEHGTTYFFLKEANLWLRSDKLTNKAAKTYQIIIPRSEY